MKQKLAVYVAVCLMVSSIQMYGDWFPAWVYFWRSQKTPAEQVAERIKKTSFVEKSTVYPTQPIKLGGAQLTKKLTDIFDERNKIIDIEKWQDLSEQVKSDLLESYLLPLKSFDIFSVYVENLIKSYNEFFSCNFTKELISQNIDYMKKFIRLSDQILNQYKSDKTSGSRILRGIVIPIKNIAYSVLNRAEERLKILSVSSVYVNQKFIQEIPAFCKQLESNKIVKDVWSAFFNNLKNFIRNQYTRSFFMNRTMYTQDHAFDDVKKIELLYLKVTEKLEKKESQDILALIKQVRQKFLDKFLIIRSSWTTQAVKGDILAVLILIADLFIVHIEQQSIKKLPPKPPVKKYSLVKN